MSDVYAENHQNDPHEIEPSAFARATAFNILTRHPECLRDDVTLNDLMDDIAIAIDRGRPKSE